MKVFYTVNTYLRGWFESIFFSPQRLSRGVFKDVRSNGGLCG
jgi:hypothetical protein